MNKFLAGILLLTLLTDCVPATPAATPTSPLPTQAPTVIPTLAPTSISESAQMQIAVTGSITNVHDPTLIKQGSMYYLISTGPGIPYRCSPDMLTWDVCGRVFTANPDWALAAIPGVKDLWAPDIVLKDGVYYLYYSASTFGSNLSAIGLATNTTLDLASPDYKWGDQGEVIASHKSDNFNAIDPNLTFDQAGQPWLVLGSFWSGIKIVKVDPATMKAAAGETLLSLATNPPSTAIEGGFITHRGDFYYLFVSHDFCCKGAQSTYNIRVGRSALINGPYLDRDGQAMTQGGGTLVLQGGERWRGPGHNSIYIEDGRYYMVYHAYDAQANGIPTLRIALLAWDADGWPQAPSGE